MFIVVTLVAVALALDQYAQSAANQLKKTIERNPEQFATQIEHLPGDITFELAGIQDHTTFFDRATGRRRLTMFYSAVAQDGNHFTNVQGTERFATSFGSFRQIVQNLSLIHI